MRAFWRGDGSDWDWAGAIIIVEALLSIQRDSRLTRQMMAIITKQKALVKKGDP